MTVLSVVAIRAILTVANTRSTVNSWERTISGKILEDILIFVSFRLFFTEKYSWEVRSHWMSTEM